MGSTPGPYPFLPLDFHGLLLEKDGHSLVLWTQSRSVEPASEGSADQTQVRALEALSYPARSEVG